MMYRDELQRFEGVWVGTEHVTDGGDDFEASARMVFQTVFDGRFLVCDYVQNAPDRPMSVGHGVFRKDDRTQVLTVSWFRSPIATSTQQSDAVAEGDKLVFVETVVGRTTRATYVVAMDRLSVRTDSSIRGGEWKPICVGSFRRR